MEITKKEIKKILNENFVISEENINNLLEEIENDKILREEIINIIEDYVFTNYCKRYCTVILKYTDFIPLKGL